MTTVAIVDYGLGNLHSVKKACEKFNIITVVTDDPNIVIKASGVILPGVGSFKEAMSYMQSKGLDEAIKAFLRDGKPFMGICLGFQLLFSHSSEFGRTKGLDVIDGEVVRFEFKEATNSFKIPHVGWNRVNSNSDGNFNGSLMSGVLDASLMYFVHSFYVVTSNSESVLATTEYGGIVFTSAIQINNIFAAQFHPEKSGETGLKIYNNFSRAVKENYVRE